MSQNSVSQSVLPAKNELFYKTVGDYTITKHLGNGKFGEVRNAQNNVTGEALAVKIVQRGKLKSKKDVDHINREITYMKMLDHPHLVALKEALQTSNNIYLFMELITGGDLIDRVTKDGRLPENVARRYFQQMVVAVRYLHLKRIAHRDLKLDNVLYDTATDSIKLADFGLANLADDANLMHTVVGSPHYVAPEVLKQVDSPGTGYDGFQADLWSLGVILFTMLSGRYPFDDQNRKRLFEIIASGEFHMSRSINPAAGALLNGMLKPNPAERYTIQDILGDPWFCTNFDPSLLLVGDGDTFSRSTVLSNGGGIGAAASQKLPPNSSPTSSSGSTSNNNAAPAMSKAVAAAGGGEGGGGGGGSGGGGGGGGGGGESASAVTPQNVPLQRMRDHPAASQDDRKARTPPSPGASLAAASGGAGSPLAADTVIKRSDQQQQGAKPPQQPNPTVNFSFLGDLESCAATIGETLRRMGCLFNKPETVAVQNSTNTRTLFGYCNPKVNPTLEVFHISMTTAAGSGGVTAVSVEHRIGILSIFEKFTADLVANLGAKAKK